jgi:hypothetical protein
MCLYPEGKKVKLSIFLIKHAMRAHGEWRYDSNVLDFETRWRRVVSFTPRPL